MVLIHTIMKTTYYPITCKIKHVIILIFIEYLLFYGTVDISWLYRNIRSQRYYSRDAGKDQFDV